MHQGFSVGSRAMAGSSLHRAAGSLIAVATFALALSVSPALAAGTARGLNVGVHPDRPKADRKRPSGPHGAQEL